MKQCTSCGEVLPTTKFGNKRWTNQDGTVTSAKKSHCRDCVNKSNLSRYHNNPNTKEAHKRASYKHRLKSYGLEPEEYEVMWERCEGCCEICGTKPVGLLFIDHSHSTGKVRGLLCGHCSSALGFVREDRGVVSNILQYLERHDESNSSGL